MYIIVTCLLSFNPLDPSCESVSPSWRPFFPVPPLVDGEYFFDPSLSRTSDIAENQFPPRWSYVKQLCFDTLGRSKGDHTLHYCVRLPYNLLVPFILETHSNFYLVCVHSEQWIPCPGYKNCISIPEIRSVHQVAVWEHSKQWKLLRGHCTRQTIFCHSNFILNFVLKGYVYDDGSPFSEWWLIECGPANRLRWSTEACSQQ